jgi:beta-glucanase (GH16 family)
VKTQFTTPNQIASGPGIGQRTFQTAHAFGRNPARAEAFGLFLAVMVANFGFSLALNGANVLSDPGFEENPVGTDIHPIAGWQWYGQEWNTLTESDGRARSGSNYFKVFGGFTGNDNYNGIYQDIPSTPAASYSADGWAYSLSSDGGGIHGQDQFWLELTFRDAGLNPLALYRSAIITGGNISNYGGLDQWFQLPITNQWSFTNNAGIAVAGVITNTVTNIVAPAGTAFARYQIIFHQGPDNANGSAYFDDCTLNQQGATGTAWNLVWSDEFNGNSIDTSHWTFETGNNGGWGNNELEYYTARPENASASNGVLHIVARKESFAGYQYTSARMKSQNLFAKKYGRFEFRAKLPAGLGYWPALWMLGANFPSVGWPACGEIDVMENKGSTPGQVQGTIHYSDGANNHLQATAYYNFASNNGATNFHTYALQWETNSMRWYVDGQLYQTRTSWSSSSGPYPAPFNQPFFIILNLAIGGNYLGNPSTTNINANTVFPGEIQLDYIRVYDLTAPLQLSLSQSNASWLLSWPPNIVCHLQAQTNSSLGTNWADVPGATNPYLIPSSPGVTSVFYRLQSP